MPLDGFTDNENVYGVGSGSSSTLNKALGEGRGPGQTKRLIPTETKLRTMMATPLLKVATDHNNWLEHLPGRYRLRMKNIQQ